VEKPILFEKARMKYLRLRHYAAIALKSLFRRRHPDDPYAMVGAPIKPDCPVGAALSP